MLRPENELLESAVGGDGDALAELLERFAPQLRRGLSGRIPNRWQAVLTVQDILQETYTDAFLDIGRFDPRGGGAFAAWLATIARRNLLDALNALKAAKRGGGWQQIWPATDGSLVALAERLSAVTPSGQVARDEALAALRRAIEKLPPAYRLVVEMYDLDGCPIEEAAKEMERTPGATFMVRARAHRLLRDIMGAASHYLSGTA